jgi:hypothetical protein
MTQQILAESLHKLDAWIKSCTRGNRVSRNTIAVGVVVLDHLQRRATVTRDDVVSQGGEIKGARSGLSSILVSHGIPASYLKEATTRQVHQDGQRLFEAFNWGLDFVSLPEEDRQQVIEELISMLKRLAEQWMQRQNLKLEIDQRQAPSTWVNQIVESAKSRSAGIVEQHLVGAKLARRFKNVQIPNYPAHAADVQTSRQGDFTVSRLVYHVTASPSRNVISKCRANLQAGSHPILLVPKEQENRARILAQEDELDRDVTIIAIEDFVAMNVIELATEENKDFISVLREIVDIYNERLLEVETDVSLVIEIH